MPSKGKKRKIKAQWTYEVYLPPEIVQLQWYDIIVIACGIWHPWSWSCLVNAEYWNDIFSIEIDSREVIGDLKKAIKEKKKPDSDHISTDELTLFKVSIPISTPDDNLNVDLESLKCLMPWKRLSELFPHVDKIHLHIKVPIVGELISAVRTFNVQCSSHARFTDFIQKAQKRGEIGSVVCIRVRSFPSFSLSIPVT